MRHCLSLVNDLGERPARTTGIMINMVGKATAHEIIHDTIQVSSTPGPQPKAL
jgi:hypothetical protein